MFQFQNRHIIKKHILKGTTVDHGIQLIQQIRVIYDNYAFDTEILAASVRHPMHIIHCAEIGADVMTGPLSAIKALAKHPLTDLGLQQFLADYAKGNK